MMSVHEAVHAVVRLARGMSFESIEIREEADGSAQGLMRIQHRPLYGAEIYTAILSNLASIPAERLLHPRYAACDDCLLRRLERGVRDV